MDRRHLLKALFAGLTLASISSPAFSTVKNSITKAKQALKTSKATHSSSAATKTAAKTATKTPTPPAKTAASGTTKTAPKTAASTSTKAPAKTAASASNKTPAKTAANTSTKGSTKTSAKTAQSTKGGRTTSRYQTAQSKASAKGARTASTGRSSGRHAGPSAQFEQDSEPVSRIDTSASLGVVRTVSVDIVNTGEKGRDIVYFENGQYQADALFELNLLLRDWRADKVRVIDPKLFDTLYLLRHMTGAHRPFEVVSAYRSPLTNFSLLLEGDGTGVARRSLHMDGRAVDIKLPGVQLAQLNKAAVQLAYGGVGYYPSSGFVHVDTGDVRRWRS